MPLKSVKMTLLWLANVFVLVLHPEQRDRT